MFSCTFETTDSTCVYTQDTTDDFNWFRHSGGTTSGGTGPKSDHTTINTLDKAGKFYLEILI